MSELAMTPTPPSAVTPLGVRPTFNIALAVGVMTRVTAGLKTSLIISTIVG